MDEGMGPTLHPEVTLGALVFVLGLKHGLDPDHLVAIDGFVRSSGNGKARRWCGLYFSLGHGLVVTLVGVVVAVLATEWQPPRWLEHTGAWISIGVLLALAVANIALLWRTPAGRAVALAGVKSRLLPERLAQASHPAVIAAVGAAFALSFDTVSHALLFSMTGATLAGAAYAGLLGVVFTAGMALTDALNGLWVARFVQGADRGAARASRVMSAAIACLCLVIAALGIAKYAAPGLEALAEHFAPLLSAGSLAVVAVAWLLARRRAAAMLG